jgi:hypothetical protein
LLHSLTGYFLQILFKVTNEVLSVIILKNTQDFTTETRAATTTSLLYVRLQAAIRADKHNKYDVAQIEALSQSPST